MMKLICPFVHRYLIPFFVFAFTALTVSYLIMDSLTSIKRAASYRTFNLINEFTSSDSSYDLRKRDLVNSHSSQATGHASQEEKLILIWSPLFENMNFLQIGKDSFKNCLETNCEITSDRTRLFESDAVLFHMRTLCMLDIPRNRTPNQKWIFFTLESPPYSHFQGFNFMDNMFNWTMTYRRDSDIFIPYGRIIPKDARTENATDLHLMWKKKTKMTAWMVSHCSTDGNREKYITQLKKFIDVDTYGSCGLGTCPFNKTDRCIENFSNQYYFFLAFENAICDDYITEKLFRTLQYDMIPIVFGGGDYLSVAPPNSFINALEFQSPKHLASYMLKVSSNSTLFASYFKWRNKNYSNDTPNHCELCQKLHSRDFKKHSAYSDINNWWVRKSHCKRWKGNNFII